MKKVLIDPGHGPGNANRGPTTYLEYQGMWKLSNFLKEVLTKHGVVADLTRDEHIDTPLSARGVMAAGYDLFISQHSNAFNGTVRGCECFYSVQRPNDRAIAARLSATVANLMQSPDRGPKTRESETTPGQDFFGVIRAAVGAGCPHVFLMESGFHDNAIDEAFLLADDNLRLIAEAQATVILDVLGVDSCTNANASTHELVSDKIPIMGKSILTAPQLAAFLLSREQSPRINCTPLELAGYFISEGEIEGVRGDIAFMQAIHETGWFRYGGLVLPEQNNFAGIGATNNSDIGMGAWFDTPQVGVRAQIQHLKAYACTLPLNQENVNPRFGFVARGSAPNWTDLNGRWAVPGTEYGQKILHLYDLALEFVGAKMPVEVATAPPDVFAAIATLAKHGVINSPEYWMINYGKLMYLDLLLINMANKLDELG